MAHVNEDIEREFDEYWSKTGPVLVPLLRYGLQCAKDILRSEPSAWFDEGIVDSAIKFLDSIPPHILMSIEYEFFKFRNR